MQNVDKMEETIVNALGYEESFEALSRALNYDTKQEMYEYIIRMYDLNQDEDE